jgi:hypothetical protein
MKRLITLMTLWTFSFFTLPLLAEQGSISQYSATKKPLTAQRINEMDQHFTRHRAMKRDFKNMKEFQRLQRDHKRYKSHLKYEYRYNYIRPLYRITPRQKGYRYSKRGWELAYRYDRADFFDSYGYHYGYFNRNGYYFEGMFYRYDRFYTYLDRVRGKGLFEHRYYMPINAAYYGFTATPYPGRF